MLNGMLGRRNDRQHGKQKQQELFKGQKQKVSAKLLTVYRGALEFTDQESDDGNAHEDHSDDDDHVDAYHAL